MSLYFFVICDELGDVSVDERRLLDKSDMQLSSELTYFMSQCVECKQQVDEPFSGIHNKGIWDGAIARSSHMYMDDSDT